jgi:hypothetical protein
VFRFEDYHEPWVRLEREITAAWEEYLHYEKRARELYDEYEELRRSKRPKDRDKAARRLDESLYYSLIARETLSRADRLLEEQKTIEREYQKAFAATSYLQSQPIAP